MEKGKVQDVGVFLSLPAVQGGPKIGILFVRLVT